MAPYAILQRQYDEYRIRLEDIAARRYRTMTNQLTQRKKSKLPERSLITKVRHFLKPSAFRQRLFLMILTGWIFVRDEKQLFEKDGRRRFLGYCSVSVDRRHVSHCNFGRLSTGLDVCSNVE